MLLVTLLSSALPSFAQTWVQDLAATQPTMLYLDTSTSTTWLYVAEHGDVPAPGSSTAPANGGRILRFNLTTGSATPQVVANRGTGAGQFISPDGMTMNTAGMLFVADRFLNKVEELSIDPTTGVGTRINGFGTATAGPSEMHGPLGLARDIGGAIYVSEHGEGNPGTGGNMVSKWDFIGGAWTRVWRVAGEGFNTPYGIAVNGTEVYVSDGFNSRVQTLSTGTGATVRTAWSVGSGIIPLGLSLDGTNLWVTEATGNTGGTQRISRRNATTGASDLTIGTAGTGPLQFALPFHAVRNSTTNRLYVSDYNNNRVQVINLAAAPSDTTAPTVASFTAPASATGGVANFTLTFSETVTGVTADDFTANTAGGATASIGTISGSGTTYTIPVTVGGTAGGTVTLTVAGGATANIRDAATNLFAGGAGSTSTAFTIPSAGGGGDTTAPTVVSIALGSATSTDGIYNVVFSENVTGVTADDFLPFATGATSASVSGVTGSGTSYQVAFTYSGASGSLQLAIRTSGTGIQDTAGNAFIGGGVTASTPVPNNVGPADMTPPTISSFTAGTPTGSSVSFALTFSEAVTGVAAADFTAITTGTASATIGTVTGTGASYTVPVTFTGTGTIQLRVAGGASTAIVDATGHVMATTTTSATASVTGSSGGDTTAPTVTSFTIASSDASSVTYQIVFSETVTGVNAADFTATRAGSTGGTATIGTLSGSGATYTIPVSFTGTGGTVVLALNASGTGIQDAAANALVGGATGPTHTVAAGPGDTTAPTVASFTIASSDASSVTYQIVFSETVTGVNAADFTATRAGSTGGTATIGTLSGSGATYTIPVSFTGTGGTVALALNASGTGIQDAAANALVGGATGPTHTVATSGGGDTTAPTVTSFTIASSNSTSVTYQIVFSETVTGVNAADFTATRAGSTGGTATIGTLGGSGATYTIPVNFTGAGGTVALALNATGTGIQDTAGNAIVGGSTGPTHTVSVPDTTAPTIVSFAAPASASAGVATFTLTFSEAVTGVSTEDFTSTLTGGATAVIGAPTGSGTTWNIPVTYGGTVGGTIRLTVAGGATANIRDAANNLFAGGTGAATSTAYTVPPAVPGITPAAVYGQVGTAIASVQVVATNSPTSWSAPGLAAYGLTLSATGVVSGTPSAAASNVSIPVTATNGAGPGTGSIVLNISPASPGGPPGGGNPGGGNPGGGFPGGGGSFPVPSLKVDQNIAFNSPVSSIFVGVPTLLGASASSGLPVSYTVVSGNATISGSTITIHNTSPVIVSASQEGNGVYNAAPSVSLQMTAVKNSQTINMAALADVTTISGPIALNATSSSGLPVTYTVTGPATIQGGMLVLSGSPGTVTVTATQSGNDAYNSATVVTRTFIVRAAGSQVFFGQMGNSPFAVGISSDGTKGIFLARLESGEGVVAKFKVEAGGSFTAQAVPAQPVAAAANGFFVNPLAAAGQTYTVTGSLNNGVISGTIVELGQNFTANVEPALGSTAGMAGVYNATVPGSASGEAYVVVGPNGRAFALAMTPSGAISGTGTVSPDGAVNITTGSGATIAGTISSGRLDGVLTAAGAVSNLVGLNDGTARTDRIINLSSRLRVASGDASRSVIAGFVVTGSQPKRVLVRAVGPGLNGFGVTGTLGNPSLQIFSGTTIVAENNDWSNNAEVMSIGESVGAFALGAGSQDAAVVASLPPGAYTAVVQANGGNGVALIEVYDADTNAPLGAQQLVNISTRGFVDTGDGQLIAGFVVSGNAPKRVLIRGIGPGLSQFGVPGAVSDPVLKVYASNGNTLVAQNDDWATAQPVNANQAAATAAEISAASTATGAFPLAGNSKDAAIVITLMPGQYSAVVSGASNGTGAGLVEVYEIPNL